MIEALHFSQWYDNLFNLLYNNSLVLIDPLTILLLFLNNKEMGYAIFS
jgi:hypothetical protein